MKRIAKVLALATLMSGCSFMSMEEVPSAPLIKKWDALAPFLVKDRTIRGIYRNIDIDSLVFSYETSATDAKDFWISVEANVATTKWSVVKSTPMTRDFERRFGKGDGSLGRPDMAIFSSAELLRVAFVPPQKVVVGYVQADSLSKSTSFAETHEARWAEKAIWPRFEKEIKTTQPSAGPYVSPAAGSPSGQP